MKVAFLPTSRPGLLRELRLRWLRARWGILSFLAFVALVLGWIGFHRLPPGHGRPDTVLDGLYKALGLFLFEGGDISGEIVGDLPWQLQWARFLAPLVVFAAAVGTALSVFHREVQRFRAHWLVRDHIVVVGLGARGLRLARRLAQSGHRCVIVDALDVAPRSTGARLLGIPVVTASEVDADLVEESHLVDLLARAGLPRAEAAVVMTGSSALNARFAYALHNMQNAGGTDARVFVEMDDVDSLRNSSGHAADLDKGQLEWFSLADRAARSLLDEIDLLLAVRTPPSRRHLVVVGRTAIGRSLAVQAIRNWSRDLGRLGEEAAAGGGSAGDSSTRSGNELVVTLVAPAATFDPGEPPPLEQEKHLLHRRDPRVPVDGAAPIQFDVVTWDVAEQSLVDVVDDPPSAVVVTADGDSDLLRLSMDATIGLPADIPVWLCTEQSGGLVDLVTGRDPSASGSPVHVFHVVDNVLREDGILRGVDEELARAVHQAHRRYRSTETTGPADLEATRTWDQLPADYRTLNHVVVAAWREVLADAQIRFVPYTRRGAESAVLPPALVERLAQASHEAWNREKKRQGYRHGLRKNNDLQRGPLAHPDIDVPFDKLSPNSRGWNLVQAELVPEHLAAAGLQLDPLPAGAGVGPRAAE